MNQLEACASFGEIALITAGPRTASVVVISEEAKCSRMSKEAFDKLMAEPRRYQAESQVIIIYYYLVL